MVRNVSHIQCGKVYKVTWRIFCEKKSADHAISYTVISSGPLIMNNRAVVFAAFP